MMGRQERNNMINVELGHVKNIVEFYKDIREGQENAHGDEYCQQHDAIKKIGRAHV